MSVMVLVVGVVVGGDQGSVLCLLMMLLYVPFTGAFN